MEIQNKITIFAHLNFQQIFKNKEKMIKKIALMLCVAVLLPLGAMAQTLKVGHVNSQEIISLMPEIEVMEKSMKEAGDQWESELLKMREEYFASSSKYFRPQNSNLLTLAN